MYTVEQIRKRLQDSNMKAVARKAGVHHNSLLAMMRGDRLPRYETLKRLSDYIDSLQ